MADLSKLRFNGTDYNVKDASAPLRKFTNYSKTGNLPITSDDTTQTAIGKLEKALDDKINTSAKGTASGVAELDANGKVPSSQLPSYVDDVLEYSAKSSFPATGETGKIYVDTTTNKTYRWSGSAYVEISESLALGETSSTAYRGDRGKAAYDHSKITNGNPHGTTGANTNLTGYSKGSSKDAVAATDTVNAAIAKHENRINANQTNILSVQNHTNRNVLSQPDGIYTATSGTRSIIIPITPISGQVVVKFGSLASTASGSTCALVFGNSGTTVALVTIARGTNVTLDVTLPSTATSLSIYPGDSYATTASGNTVTWTNGMVIQKELYDLDSSYSYYSAPNYDLTRLESEDRAALAKEIDAGAKNKATISSGNNTGTTRWFEIPVTDLKIGETYIVYFGSITSTDTDDTRCQAIFMNGSTYCSDWLHFGRGSDKYLSVKITSNPAILRIYAADSYATSENDILTFSNLMICTKAAFGVSNKFVPYRPSWDTVQSAITPSTFTITPETGVTIATATKWKCNGLAFFALSCSRATAIPANTSIVIGTIEASSMKIGDSLVVFTARGDSDTIPMSTIIGGYISAGNQQYIKIRASAEIPANAVVYVTGTFRCK